MRYAPEHKVDAYAHAVRGLASLEDDPEKPLKYMNFIDIYADLNDNERNRYEREYPEEAEIMSSFSVAEGFPVPFPFLRSLPSLRPIP